MRGHVHHLDLTVRDPWASAHFYDTVLGFMGYRRSGGDADGLDWDLPGIGRDFASIGLVAATGEGVGQRYDRRSPGLHHVAWHADSRADVDAMYQCLLELGAVVLDAPADYPEYGDGYYAVFFVDPDGLKLEFVYLP